MHVLNYLTIISACLDIKSPTSSLKHAYISQAKYLISITLTNLTLLYIRIIQKPINIIQLNQPFHSYLIIFHLKHTISRKMMQMPYQRQGTSMTSDDCSEKLQLFFAARNLADLDLISTTDSFLVIKLSQTNKPERTILKTKVYWNTLNPDYAETVTIDYFFQIRQKLRIEVFHEASPPKFIGGIQTTVGEIFGSPQNGLKKQLINVKNKKSGLGQIIIKCEKVEKVTNNILQFSLQAYQLPAGFRFLCFGSALNSFFRLYRVRQKDQLLIYESETVQGTDSPRFKRAKISQRRLCKNNPDAEFEIRFYNYSNMGNHSLIGKVVTTVNKTLDPRNMAIMHQNKKRGMMRMANIKRSIKHSFVDYISAGLQLMLITCIDFTASNGSAKSPQSLHYMDQNRRSQYEEALGEVSNILLDYDSDKLVPVYGFGAKVSMPNYQTYGKVHHCFPLNGNQQNSHVFMVQGIIQAYRNCIPFLEFGGPTMFNLLLSQAIQQGQSLKRQLNQYMIVFILTDGQIHDKRQVIDQLVICCELPISIIIVGVGNGPFDIMEELDDDDCQLRDSQGRKTTRDLVQFVEFKKFRNNGVELAREVLEELPRQVEEYYQLINISPMNFPPPPPPMMMPPPQNNMMSQNNNNFAQQIQNMPNPYG